MQVVSYFVIFYFISFSYSHESNSADFNRIEISPFYDTIIFSDVIDIVNELNKNLNLPIDDDSESESDENVEDLLTEYQIYLDKAHEQRRLFLEKSNKTKNKVPLLRRENFVKSSVPFDEKYNNYYRRHYYNPDPIKFEPTSYNSPLDFFIPLSPSMNNFNKLASFNTPQSIDFKREPSVYPVYPKLTNGQIKSSCFCKPNEIPCKCNYKQCLVATPETGAKFPNPSAFEDMKNTLNLRIKVDVQLPKTLDRLVKYGPYNRDVTEFDELSKEFSSAIRLPSTYFNYPIPMDLLGYKKMTKISRHDSPMHKITIHKKKKSRLGTNNKKHHKKLITFHNINLSPSLALRPIAVGNSSFSNTTRNNEILGHQNITIDFSSANAISTNSTATITELPMQFNNTQTDESIYVMVNISNNSENEKDEVQKTGNSIELEYKTNITTESNRLGEVRKKRDAAFENSSKLDIITKQQNVSGDSKVFLSTIKKSNRSILAENELLYWPTTIHNQSLDNMKNITAIILEQENKKARLNISTEAIRNNRTMALEKAIFGNVDWDDVDTVVPTFISFIGKYINGILTFCSDKICHSIKCANESCIHRTCAPELRFNNMGHCGGCNKTDSVASMESILDLPSNVAFEVVDILQDKMLGKVYGKVTLCINNKCSSFVASKKTFIKFKCSSKSLDNTGHCPSIKKS